MSRLCDNTTALVAPPWSRFVRQDGLRVRLPGLAVEETGAGRWLPHPRLAVFARQGGLSTYFSSHKLLAKERR